MEIADRVLRLLQTVDTTEPDIVIGDFNMTRNSFAIQTMFPELHDVAIDSGVGVLASFPVEYPLYHIDHVLIGSQLRAANYKLINPHIGRHRIQVAEINP
jgi:endonuclease/exonuclease/phosphatase family metal-dependent hydrolase